MQLESADSLSPESLPPLDGQSDSQLSKSETQVDKLAPGLPLHSSLAASHLSMQLSRAERPLAKIGVASSKLRRAGVIVENFIFSLFRGTGRIDISSEVVLVVCSCYLTRGKFSCRVIVGRDFVIAMAGGAFSFIGRTKLKNYNKFKGLGAESF